MSSYDDYYAVAKQQLDQVFHSQRGALESVAGWLGEALVRDGWLYAFGTGHSHMLAEEIFYRAGSLAHANPILDPALMLHENAIEATYLERREGYAASLLDRYPVEAGDVLIVASNSGRNAVPIELAMEGRKRGLTAKRGPPGIRPENASRTSLKSSSTTAGLPATPCSPCQVSPG